MSGRPVRRATGPIRSFVVVAYDIGDDRRRARVAEVLLGFGGRIQGSVYELWLDERRLERLWSRISEEVGEGDLVRCYVVCTACRLRTRAYGSPPPQDVEVFIV